MMIQTQLPYHGSTNSVPVGEFGSMSIRIVVLPKKKPNSSAAKQVAIPLDLEDGELVDEPGATAMSSYLESGKGGKQCVVFLVNGQRQDALDNSFIIKRLGYKYLRHRMMVIIDVDNLTQEALGRLMQGSRQTFYRGDVFDAILTGVVSTLKDDPDLDRLEQEAEEEVAELQAGDAKVKQTLDQLIESHHDYGMHVDLTGRHSSATKDGDGEQLGLKTVVKDGVVSLLPADEGTPADYPVLISQPASSTIRLRPNEERRISIKTVPANAWPALAELTVDSNPAVPELSVSQDRLADHLRLSLMFRETPSFDTDHYPIRTTLPTTARFNGIREPRRLELNVLIRPETEPVEPILVHEPTWLRVSSRRPINIRRTDTATHVRLRWNGRDDLAAGLDASWKFYARFDTEGMSLPKFQFSEPFRGRFSLLVQPHVSWNVGQEISFEVGAIGPTGKELSAKFNVFIVEPMAAPLPTPPKAPRRVEADVHTGSNRRPPYDLRYINRSGYATETCWSEVNWTDQEVGCFQAPTSRTPLTLIINNDLASLIAYRRYLTKKFTESEVERRITKYTSHVAFHLYQMYEAIAQDADVHMDDAEKQARSEIQRVSSTLIKLMEVSR